MRAANRTLVSLAATLVAPVLGAQTQFEELGGRIPPRLDYTRAVAFGDLDRDGDLDLIVGNQDTIRCCFLRDGLAPSSLYLNDGTGSFTDATNTHFPRRVTYTWDIAVVDVDADQDPDLILAGAGQSLLYLNDSTGRFTDVTVGRMPLDTAVTSAVTVADMDGDGDPDVVLANRKSQNRLYLNDGSGTFADGSGRRMPDDNHVSYAVTSGDVDGDGDTDLIFGNTGQNTLYLNDGTGTFLDVTSTNMPRKQDVTLAVELGDLDGDGDLDLVTGDFFSRSHVYLNDGAGAFTDVSATHLAVNIVSDVRAAALGDADNDGDLDIAFATNLANNQLFLNDGTGVFTDASSQIPARSDKTRAVAFGDIDGDGDQDLVFGSGDLPSGEQNWLYVNTLRQLDTPSAVFVGGTYQLDAYARGGNAALGDVAHLLLSGARANIPIGPAGTLFVDPAGMAALPPIAISQPLGLGRLSLPVPSEATLVGAPLFAQALIVQGTSAALTNLTVDVIQ